MGASASVEVGVSQAINRAVNNVAVSEKYKEIGPLEKTHSNFFESVSSHRPVLLVSMSIKSFALKNHSKHHNSYIAQEPVLGSFTIKKNPILDGGSIRRPAGLILNTTSNSDRTNKSKEAIVGRPKLKLNLGNEDEADWVQVSDDDDMVLSPRARKQIMLRNNQSYMFTQSGTIFVNGFSEGIGKDGIHNSGSSSHFSLSERLVLLCNLGQGASGIVYKAFDLQDMRLVAIKMISVFDRGKRHQMVQELGALFNMIHTAEFEGDGSAQGAKLAPKAVEFGDMIKRRSTRTDTESFGVKAPREYIVDFYDAFSNLEDGGVGLMMEYMDGGSLQVMSCCTLCLCFFLSGLVYLGYYYC